MVVGEKVALPTGTISFSQSSVMEAHGPPKPSSAGSIPASGAKDRTRHASACKRNFGGSFNAPLAHVGRAADL